MIVEAKQVGVELVLVELALAQSLIDQRDCLLGCLLLVILVGLLGRIADRRTDGVRLPVVVLADFDVGLAWRDVVVSTSGPLCFCYFRMCSFAPQSLPPPTTEKITDWSSPSF